MCHLIVPQQFLFMLMTSNVTSKHGRGSAKSHQNLIQLAIMRNTKGRFLGYGCKILFRLRVNNSPTKLMDSCQISAGESCNSQTHY